MELIAFGAPALSSSGSSSKMPGKFVLHAEPNRE